MRADRGLLRQHHGVGTVPDRVRDVRCLGAGRPVRGDHRLEHLGRRDHGHAGPVGLAQQTGRPQRQPAVVRVAEYDVPGKTALKVYARYQAALQSSNAVDFGDLIVRVIEQRAKPHGQIVRIICSYLDATLRVHHRFS